MTNEVLKLCGNVVGISSVDPCDANEEHLILYVKGARSLYVEFQLPDGLRWKLGQKVVVTVVALPADKPITSVN